jgi:two-component system, OmpR family, phosphate regulon response regulator PhoB
LIDIFDTYGIVYAGSTMTRILIVEDHADIRRLIRMTLEFAGIHAEVTEATNGTEGLDAARRTRPDVVLTDLMMPGGPDGLALCRHLKADPDTRGATVVMITAKGQAADRRAGLEAGVQAYLIKPFSPLELIQTLDELGIAA